jgi:dienelactone hydrolase
MTGLSGGRSLGTRWGIVASLVLISLLLVARWRMGPRQPQPFIRADWSGKRPTTNVRFPSDGRSLKGWVYAPEKNLKGRSPAVIWNHGSEADVRPGPPLVETYLSHGFVIFIPVRRYHRPSTDGPTIMELMHGRVRTLSPAAAWNSPLAAAAWIELNEEENRDVLHALEWLKKQPYVDPERIVVSGVSFGGVQTLLAAERGAGFKAAIAFSPAAMSWGDGKSKINARMEAAVRNRRIPLFLIQAKNDFSLGPTDVLGPLLDAVNLQHRVKQYPEFGTRTPEMSDEQWHGLGHGAFPYQGSNIWGPDVFAFIAEAFARPPP